MSGIQNVFPDPYITGVDLIGDGWTFLITRETFFGITRFSAYLDVLKISRPRLTERLRHLIAVGIIKKHPYQTNPLRYEYRLTDMGLSIFPIAMAMRAWGERWRPGVKGVGLKHTPCDHTLTVKSHCRTCALPLKHKDIDWLPIIPLSTVPGAQSVKGWRKISGLEDISPRKDPAIGALSAVGDRWSMLIIYGAQHQPIRFRQAQSTLGLAHNVLSSRLKHLVKEGLLERESGHRNAAYIATPAGRAFLDMIFIMRSWVMDNVENPHKHWASIYHTPCGVDLKVDSVCSYCHMIIDPRDIAY